MSLLSSFVANHLVASLEEEFVKHAPELQAAFLAEVEAFSADVIKWLKSKSQAQAK
jgi:hypothetical protein